MSTNAESLASALAALMDREQSEKAAKKWEHTEVGLEYDGTKIKLPADPNKMPLSTAIQHLQALDEAENTKMDVREVIDAYPYDAAVAFIKALKETYGWATPVPTKSFFGDINPDLVNVKTGPNYGDIMQVPIGQFKIPGVTGTLSTGFARGERGQPVFVFGGTIRRREQDVVKGIARLTREILQRESIYRGKALRLQVDKDGNLGERMEPIFLKTDYIAPEELILNRDVQDLVEVALLTPIKHSDLCRSYGIPLKRGILLEGPYGTGKTMTANICSRVCVENGWTYIMLDNVKGLKAALEFAQRYQPAVIFAEDIDRITSDRDEKANDLLNTIDGVLTKDAKVITVLTTNHVDRINKAMIRPGRLDAVISVRPPDADAVQKLVRLYGRGLLSGDENLDNLGAELQGNIPATIREVVERSKLGMIQRGDTRLTERDLLVAARGMRYHLELLQGPVDDRQTPEHILGSALGSIISSKLEGLDTDSMHSLLEHAADADSQSAQALNIVNEHDKLLKTSVMASLSMMMETLKRLEDNGMLEAVPARGIKLKTSSRPALNNE